jgi:hypothetical protein
MYDLEKDPRELTNIVRANAAEATTLRAELTKLLARHQPHEQAPKADASSTTRNALQSLGYLSVPPRTAASGGADPKDRIAEYQLFEKSLDAFYARRLDTAIAGFRRVLAMDPAMTPAKQALAEAQK